VARPAQTVSKQEGLYSGHFASAENFGVWHKVLPFDPEDKAKMAEVETI
jgi:hypothetical protein